MFCKRSLMLLSDWWLAPPGTAAGAFHEKIQLTDNYALLICSFVMFILIGVDMFPRIRSQLRINKNITSDFLSRFICCNLIWGKYLRSLSHKFRCQSDIVRRYPHEIE